MLKDNVVYFQEFLRDFESTGTICPTSRWAVRSLSSPLIHIKEPVTILEVGAGTGVVTVQILKRMKNDDELVICEINPRFMKALKEKLSVNRDFIKHRDRISFFEGPVQDLPESKKYDVMVCALPFLNFELDVVKEIFSKLGRMSKEKTLMTYYEYMGIRQVSRVVSPQKRKERMKAIDSYFHSFKNLYVNRDDVWLNFPPIYVYTLQFAGGSVNAAAH